MVISTFTFGYFWLKRATALVTDLSSAALPKAINRKLAETSEPAAKPLLDASMRQAANRKIGNFDFTGVPPYGGIESVPFNIAVLISGRRIYYCVHHESLLKVGGLCSVKGMIHFKSGIRRGGKPVQKKLENAAML